MILKMTIMRNEQASGCRVPTEGCSRMQIMRASQRGVSYLHGKRNPHRETGIRQTKQ